MTDQEILGAAMAYTDAHSGGGGGTSDYSQLSNKPQIGGVTLSGNKSASDLGLVAEVDGKGLSTNDYTDADKAIVGGVTAALAGKQDVLTAGKYINIDTNNEISVNPVVPNEAFKYVLQQIENYTIKVTKSVNNVVVSEETYGPPTGWDAPVEATLDEAIHIYIHMTGTMFYDLLIASDTHEAGFKQTMSWFGRDTFTENFSTVDHSGEKLITKSELDTAINAIKDGQSIDSFADVETALANKQDKTDNSLQTTDKTVVGAVNELKSGLTNYENQNDLNLEVPNRKNLIPMTVDGLKKNNTVGTWTGNSYAINNSTIDVLTDTDGNVTGVKLNGTYNDTTLFYFDLVSLNGSYIINGCPSGGSATSYRLDLRAYDGGVMKTDTGNGANTGNVSIQARCVIRIENGTVCNNIIFQPMIRLATITDPTFAPYIPSVDSRIKAVESGLTSFKTLFVSATTGDYRDKFNSMYSTISALNFHDRVKSFINFTGTICNYCDMTGGAYIYIGSYYSGKLTKIIVTVDPQYSGTMKMEIDETAVTKTDLHTTEDNNKFTLYM